jgi:exodeoxyribonuclease X
VVAVILDTETTGLNEPVLVEACFLAIESPTALAITDHFCKRYNPGKPIEWGAMATHHILPDDVADAPPASSFRLPDGCEYLIGHNVDFDWQVIGKPNVKRICTLAFSRKFWPDGDHSLGAMLYRLEGNGARLMLRGAHSAEADARNCRVLLGHILGELKGVRTWDDLWRESEAARIPQFMTFGKHKGMALSDVPRDYKQWLLKQPDVDPYLAKALRA